MEKLDKMINNLKTLQFDDILQILLKRKVYEKFILSANKSRLYNTGRDEKGVKLRTDKSKIEGRHPSYAEITVNIKEGKVDRPDKKSSGNRRTDNVTLMDQGDFYDSFVLLVKKTYAEIIADFNKKDGHIQENFELSYSNKKKFENKILGLTEKDKDQLFKTIKPDIQKELKIILKL